MIIERDIQDRKLHVECLPAYSHMAGNVLDVFEHLALSGTQLGPGTQVRFGWSLLRIQADGNKLWITEPDFALWPEQRWLPGIDTTLRILSAQTSLLHRLQIEGQDVFFDQMIIAAPGALAQPAIFLRRTPNISVNDSGWLLGSIADPDALTREQDLEAVSIASLTTRRPELLQALILPVGFIAIFNNELLEQILDPDNHVRSFHSGAADPART